MNIISALNLEQTKQLIKKAKEKPIIVQAQDDEFNRKILEYGKFDILLDIHSGQPRKDKLKQKDSGFNEVLARIAAKNNISIGIDLEKLRDLEKKEKALAVGRIAQNISLCRKSKTQIALLNIRDNRDARSFLMSLGASSEQAAKAITF